MSAPLELVERLPRTTQQVAEVFTREVENHQQVRDGFARDAGLDLPVQLEPAQPRTAPRQVLLDPFVRLGNPASTQEREGNLIEVGS